MERSEVERVCDLMGVDSWVSEADFVVELRAALPDFLMSRFAQWQIYSEVGVGRRTADVVIPASRQSPAVMVMPLSELESVVLAALRRLGPTRIDLLERRSGFHRGGLRRNELSRLEGWNFLRRGPGGRIALASGWATDLQIVAIEAKLRRWTRALTQARAYQRYADFSYLALPWDVARRVGAQHAGTLVESGVGLLSLSSDGIEELVAAQTVGDHGWQREYVASRLPLDSSERGH